MDLLIISVLGYFILRQTQINAFHFLLYEIGIWFILSFLVQFYSIYRFTKPTEIISKISRQCLLFLLLVIAFYPFSKQAVFNFERIFLFSICSTAILSTLKFGLFYYLKIYRIQTSNNYRSAIIIGYSKEAIELKELFEKRIEYGYRFLGFFSDKKTDQEISGKLDEVPQFILNNKVDEIYCSLNEVSNQKLKELIDFADENNKILKFIPDTKIIFSKNLKMDYYDFFPVLSLKETLLNEPTIKIVKRLFDVIFSLVVILGILSWLTPLLALLIKLESKGPVFFKQGRPGINENEFHCYKFRSMRMNATTETEASKGDPRVTRIGRIMRKTSIDETPQFLNVLLGDMSVVGPRPHLWAQNKIYGTKINKYMKRHYVKPGITGLAQVSGFRGEIERDRDMINRIKLDVFYIENWSFILDLKIIYQTLVNIYKGEDKAY
jgi:putative colanic acid biosynthesis UDP-glucose lipid carrier transferase